MTRRQQKIRAAALSMIERYGRAACQQVDQRISELQQHGEDEAVSLWRAIGKEIDRLLDKGSNGKSQ